MDTFDKMKTVATGLVSNMKSREGGGEKETYAVADHQLVHAVLEDWPALSKQAAERTIAKYGYPNEATASRLIWYNNGPWKRTICYRDEIAHNFPQPHSDVIENFIDYQVPLDKLDELARFDGSVIVDRTKGEVSARCDMEEANFLSLNLMHDIVSGKLTVDAARKQYAETTAAFMLNQPAPYTQGLCFAVPHGSTAYQDESIMGETLLQQAKQKMNGMLGRHPQ